MKIEEFVFESKYPGYRATCDLDGMVFTYHKIYDVASHSEKIKKEFEEAAKSDYEKKVKYLEHT